MKDYRLPVAECDRLSPPERCCCESTSVHRLTWLFVSARCRRRKTAPSTPSRRMTLQGSHRNTVACRVASLTKHNRAGPPTGVIVRLGDLEPVRVDE